MALPYISPCPLLRRHSSAGPRRVNIEWKRREKTAETSPVLRGGDRQKRKASQKPGEWRPPAEDTVQARDPPPKAGASLVKGVPVNYVAEDGGGVPVHPPRRNRRSSPGPSPKGRSLTGEGGSGRRWRSPGPNGVVVGGPGRRPPAD